MQLEASDLQEHRVILWVLQSGSHVEGQQCILHWSVQHGTQVVCAWCPGARVSRRRGGCDV